MGRSSIVGNEMDRSECKAFLTSRGHGVLSMGFENRGYGVPISFGYDEEDSRIILQFVSTPDSKKQTSAKNSKEVTVTVYNYESVDSWESVIVTGTIHPMDADEVSERFGSLPMEIDWYLTGAVHEHGQRFNWQEYVDRVSEVEQSDPAEAAYHDRVIVDLVSSVIPDSDFWQLRDSLPESEDDESWRKLFEIVDEGGWGEAEEGQTGGGPQSEA